MAKKSGPVRGSATALVRVPFEGESLEAVNEGGKVWVSVRRVCEALGLATQRQLAKLKGKPWATITLKVSVAEDGKPREVAMVDLDALPMWLATVEAARVAEGVRPKLVAYQQKAAAVLRDHFFPRPAPAIEPPAQEGARSLVLASAPDDLQTDVLVLLRMVETDLQIAIHGDASGSLARVALAKLRGAKALLETKRGPR